MPVTRDRWGIPHVEAGDLDGLFHGQGYACAQDRLWQIEWDRRRALGRTSALIGAASVPLDHFALRLRIADAARQGYADLDDESRAMLVAYTRGVNDAIADGARAFELERLDAPQPDRWEPWHPIAVFLVRHVAFGGAWVAKLFRARVLRHYGADSALGCRREGIVGEEVTTITGERVRIPAPEVDVRPCLEALALLDDHVLDAPADARADDGSNSWAVPGTRTASGMPILAGDPHRALEAPNVYLQVYLRAPGIDACGIAFAGVPGIPHFGHAGCVAWCVTNAAADTDDVYVERREAVADRRVETIEVRDADPVTVESARTRHGPVIAGDAAVLVLRSAGLSTPGGGFASIVPLLRAKTVDDVDAALRHWVDPANNWLAADSAGRVRYMTRGHIPRKPELNRWLPVPGWTTDYDWTGIRDDLPCFDAKDEPIVTANNRISADTTISPDFAGPGRSVRIGARLRAMPSATAASMTEVHRDDVTLPGLRFVEDVKRLAPAHGALEVFAGWDGRMHRDSSAAALYAATRDALARLVARSVPSLAGRVEPEPPAATPVAFRVATFCRALASVAAFGLDWDALLVRALDAACAQAPPRWGDLHRSRHAHALRLLAPDVAASATPPPVEVDGDAECVLCTGTRPGVTYDAVHASCVRYAFEVGGRPAGMWVVALGASGDPAGPHFTDQQDAWSRGEMVPIAP